MGGRFTEAETDLLREFRVWLLDLQNDTLSPELATEISVEFNAVASILGLENIDDPYADAQEDDG